MSKTIFHIDVNSAYLSWEAVSRLQKGEELDLRTIPSAVGGNPKKRNGIILAKSIPAKKYNIKTGETLHEAFKKCPELCVVSPSYDLYMKCSNAMYEILKNGGLKPGGLNFDAKLRRPSFKTTDLFYGHIAGMDSFAYGLKVAHKMLQDGVLEDFIDKRYSGYDKEIGKKIIGNEVDLEDLEDYILNKNNVVNESGRQERLESIINQYVLEVDNL